MRDNRLAAVWRDHSFANEPRYEPALYPFFLRLMQKYDVSYRLEAGDARSHYNLGLSFRHLDQSDEAFKCFTKTLELDPTHAEAHYQIGTQLLRQNALDQAIRSLSRATELSPGYGAAHYNLALALYEMQSYEQAWIALRRARSADHAVPSETIQLMRSARGTKTEAAQDR